MKRKTFRKTELLSPAGSFESARAAVNAGADAIYMGGPLFSARAFAESSAKDMLLDSIEYCHMRDVRVFMTLNTLLKDSELDTVGEYLRPYVDKQLDGVIIQDMGVFRKVRELYPELELHVSTQAAITGARTAKRYMEMGAKRIVLARELSLEEIRSIRQQTGAELEVFAHGALCYCYSGDCLMSSFIGGRSGNRGKCAGTCRLPFDVTDINGNRLNKKDEKYLLSMCDLNTLKRLADMIEAGVYSFKIEGRMKSPEYTATVTSVYRKYLDIAEAALSGLEAEKDCGFEHRNGDAGASGTKTKASLYKVEKSDEKLLSEVFDRSGSTDGYLDHRNGRSMLTIHEKPELRSRDEQLIALIREKYIDNDMRLPVDAFMHIKTGETLWLKLSCGDISAEAAADFVVEKAGKRPTSAEDVRDKISKLGNTDFELRNFETDMDEECFVPVSTLNELRRIVCDELKRSILEGEC